MPRTYVHGVRFFLFFFLHILSPENFVFLFASGWLALFLAVFFITYRVKWKTVRGR